MRERERESTAVAPKSAPSLDVVFDLLANRRRRYALYYLYDRPDGVSSLDDLVDGVLTYEVIEGDVEDHRTTVRTSLQHVHLPKLEDAGIVEYDPRSETVRYWTQPSLEEWLEHAHHKERP
ncbi:hypothetical protein ACFQGT_14650 [Natrialbaceae archaeon GCM10025810]|uniref:DUF7344 domain-containing protein n=1 Tax=Halovalidus salilacus TaxID=3075124 RepID=UPI00361372D4